MKSIAVWPGLVCYDEPFSMGFASVRHPQIL